MLTLKHQRHATLQLLTEVLAILFYILIFIFIFIVVLLYFHFVTSFNILVFYFLFFSQCIWLLCIFVLVSVWVSVSVLWCFLFFVLSPINIVRKNVQCSNLLFLCFYFFVGCDCQIISIKNNPRAAGHYKFVILPWHNTLGFCTEKSLHGSAFRAKKDAMHGRIHARVQCVWWCHISESSQ